MKRGPYKKKDFFEVEGLNVTLVPVPEASAEFERRKAEVQTMIAKMIWMSKRRGRPVAKEDEYEEAA
jgi:hypothetical protein